MSGPPINLALTSLRFGAGLAYSAGVVSATPDTSVGVTSASGTITWTVGAGSPEGVASAYAGSIYSRIDGGVGATFYVKETGSAAYGWAAK